jgi:hypothetical protein
MTSPISETSEQAVAQKCVSVWLTKFSVSNNFPTY